MLNGKCIVLGVTGGIAAYKTVDVISRLIKLGAEVDVVMTKNATRFVAPLTFETISARPVTTDTFHRPDSWKVEHVALAKKAELALIAPATANLMAKLTYGIADDMLTTLLLATRAPILLAPAMNTGMWDAAATQRNRRILAARGVRMIGPETGLLACGDVGAGRMSEPAQIVEAVQRVLCPMLDMEGLRVLVTAGPTVERLDPVRYMTNDSSGKMGYALAEAARDRGARVTLVSGPVSLAPPAGIERVSIVSTRDLYAAMLARCAAQDVIVQAAAPSDYRFAAPSQRKLKKQGEKSLAVELLENPDVAEAVGARKKPGQVLVGFAAETDDMLANARKKLESKHLDMIVANDVSKGGFGAENIAAVFLTGKTERRHPMMRKREMADRIWDAALMLRGGSV